jgi:hypothetical protein
VLETLQKPARKASRWSENFQTFFGLDTNCFLIIPRKKLEISRYWPVVIFVASKVFFDQHGGATSTSSPKA